MVGCTNFFFMIESLLFIGAGARAGEKNTRRRSKMDRLRNTAFIYIYTGKYFFGIPNYVTVILMNIGRTFGFQLSRSGLSKRLRPTCPGYVKLTITCHGGE